MHRLVLGLLLLLGAVNANAFDFQRYSGCTDPDGNDVLTVLSSTEQVAIAYIDPTYGPVILFDWKEARIRSQELVDFIYLHECAHHALGHLYRTQEEFDKMKGSIEQEADCYAKRHFIRRFGVDAYKRVLKEVEEAHGWGRRLQIEMCR